MSQKLQIKLAEGPTRELVSLLRKKERVWMEHPTISAPVQLTIRHINLDIAA